MKTSLALAALLAASLAASLAGAGVVLSGAAAGTADRGLGDARPVAAAGDLHAAAVFAGLMGKGGESVLLSPLSLGSALALLAQGSDGATREAMAEGLRWTDTGLDAAAAAYGYQMLREQLTATRPGVELSLANALFTAPDFPVTPAYAELAGAMFAAKAESLAFGTPAAEAAVNDWVSKETQGRIPGLPLDLGANTQVVILNALFFKGAWAVPFDPELTAPAAFTPQGAEPVEAPFMSRNAKMPYLETEAFRAVALPYADPRFDCVLALPKPEAGEALAADLVARGWNAVFDSVTFEERQGTLKLPRLSLRWTGDLTQVLGATGLAPAFAADADWSKMSVVGTRITQVVQDVRIEVTEEGAEAAAATGATGSRGVEPEEPFELVLDRPFYLMLRDKQTGAVLVMAHVARP